MSERRMWPTPQAYNERGSRAAYVAAGKGGMDLVTAVQLPDAPPASNQLTLFAEAFPASPTPWLADVPAQTTSAISGPSSSDSFASLDPDGSWRKTCQGYSQVMLDGSLARFSETWPRAGMTRNGTAYRRQPSAPLTDATECGSSPTPQAYSHGEDSNPLGLTKLDIQVRGLYRDDPKHARYWPTPCAEDAKNVPYQKGDNGTRYPMLLGAVAPERMWPTPRAEHDSGKHRGSLDTLHSAIKSAHPHSGALNPTWVEWLMGYPRGWTACAASATPSSRRSRNGSRGGSSRPKA